MSNKAQNEWAIDYRHNEYFGKFKSKLDKKYGIKDKLVGKTGAGMATRAAGVLGATYLKGRSDESESRRPSKNTGFSYYDKDF